MCRNIRCLHNAGAVASKPEIEAASSQFVRKVSGIRTGKGERPDLDQAVADISKAVETLLRSLASGENI